jgi:hypothetical protein
MKATSLTSTQCWTVSSYLRMAAGRFQEFSEMAMLPPASPRIRDQFLKQMKEANDLADLFAKSEFAHLEDEE